MAVTLLEAAATQGGYTQQEAAVIKMFTELNPIAEQMPMERIDGRTYSYNRDIALPGIGWRAVNQAWTESTGVVNPFVERLMILGGEMKIDEFILNTEPARAPSEWEKQVRLKVQAASNEFSRAVLEGDDLVDTNQLVGLRRRLTGTQVILAGSGGVTLTLAMVDSLIDLVPFNPKVLYMSRAVRRKFTNLVNASSGAVRIQYEQDMFGRQQEAYAGVPIRIIETTGDASTLLAYDEDPGDGTADTASIYCVAYGSELVHGIYNGPNGKSFTVKDFGELQSEPRRMGRMECYLGMCIEHPRAAARLRGITNT